MWGNFEEMDQLVEGMINWEDIYQLIINDENVRENTICREWELRFLGKRVLFLQGSYYAIHGELKTLLLPFLVQIRNK